MHSTVSTPKRRAFLHAVLAILVLALAVPAAAQPAKESRSTSPADGPIPVVATFSILGDMVARIGGEHIDLTTLVGPDGDTHVYQPTPADARAVSEARILFVNGLQFEGWLERLTEAADFHGVLVVATDGIELIAFDEHAEHDMHDEHDEDDMHDEDDEHDEHDDEDEHEHDDEDEHAEDDEHDERTNTGTKRTRNTTTTKAMTTMIMAPSTPMAGRASAMPWCTWKTLPRRWPRPILAMPTRTSGIARPMRTKSRPSTRKSSSFSPRFPRAAGPSSPPTTRSSTSVAITG